MDQNDDGLKGENPDVRRALKSMNWEERLEKARAQRQAILDQKKAEGDLPETFARRSEPVIDPAERSEKAPAAPEPAAMAEPAPKPIDEQMLAALRSFDADPEDAAPEEPAPARVPPSFPDLAPESEPEPGVPSRAAARPRALAGRLAVRIALGFGLGLGIGTSLVVGAAYLGLGRPESAPEPSAPAIVPPAPERAAATPQPQPTPVPVEPVPPAAPATGDTATAAPPASEPVAAVAAPPLFATDTAAVQRQAALLSVELPPRPVWLSSTRPLLAPRPVFPRAPVQGEAPLSAPPGPPQPLAVSIPAEVSETTAPADQDSLDVGLAQDGSEPLAPARSTPPPPKPVETEDEIALASLSPPEAQALAQEPQPAVTGAEGLTVYVHAPGTVPQDEFEAVAGSIGATGATLPDPRRVSFKVSETHLRYFHAADAGPARELADLIGARARDFTSFRPSPPDGTIEVYLAGENAVAPSRAPAATRQPDEVDLLRDRLVRSLRRGDHLE